MANTRSCIWPVESGHCLGHPEVDSPLYPSLCRTHIAPLMPMINARAAQEAQRILADEDRRAELARGRRNQRIRDRAVVRLEDKGTLLWLAGPAA